MPFPKPPKHNPSPSQHDRITDPRFADLQTDPRYRPSSKKHHHVKLDSRFSRMLRDDEFSRKATVDRYGRKIPKSAGKKELERFYKLEEDEDKEGEDDEEWGGFRSEGDDATSKSKGLKSALRRGKENSSTKRELHQMDGYDPARDGGFSSSGSDESSDEEEEDADELEAAIAQDTAGQEHPEDVPMGEVSSRLAAVNLDWDNIRAVDLLAVAASFVPKGGRISHVAVYPSEFGRERIDREDVEGPPKELFKASKRDRAEEQALSDEGEDTSDDDEQDQKIKRDLLQEEDSKDFDSTALRAYQLQRLRYYYAVITCDSNSTAQALYEAMDGREYLSSANFFDLRFVPDETTFDEKPRDSCTSVPDGYKPNEFVTDALTHSKVKLTWDADDRTRKEVQKRAFSRKEMDENDLMAYIGSGSSEEESDEELEEDDDVLNGDTVSVTPSKGGREQRAAELRAKLGLDDGSLLRKSRKGHAPSGEMQVTFSAGLMAKPTTGTVFENEPVVEETTIDKYKRQEKERKARRKERSEARREGRDPDAVVHEESNMGPSAQVEENKMMEDEAGFDDPFFNDPEAATREAAKAARKADKARKRAEREAEEKVKAAERRELELLMVDEEGETAQGVRHFDMNSIIKQEKGAKKKKNGKQAKKARKEAEANANGGVEVDTFEMDTQDPRFASLWENHEFAIDPTNPKFKKTRAMEKLLEEGRKKRKGDIEDVEEQMGGGVGRSAKKIRLEGSDGEGVERLVERVKARVA